MNNMRAYILKGVVGSAMEKICSVLNAKPHNLPVGEELVDK